MAQAESSSRKAESETIDRPDIHKHPLKLSDERGQNFKCDVCSHRGSGKRYQCAGCDFDLHIQCPNMAQAESSSRKVESETIDRPDIHKHPLKLSDENGQNFTCDVCSQRGSGKRYQCAGCGFDLHIQCPVRRRKRDRVRGAAKKVAKFGLGIIKELFVDVAGEKIADMMGGDESDDDGNEKPEK